MTAQEADLTSTEPGLAKGPPATGASRSARSSSHVMAVMDRAVARLLRVQPNPVATPEAAEATGTRPFDTPLLVTAARCILRYVVLPFVLPILGVTAGATLGIVTGAALGLLLCLDIIAVIAIVATLRRLWQVRHPYRLRYMPVALALVVLVGMFFVTDARALVA
jgi:hypothetical protein